MKIIKMPSTNLMLEVWEFIVPQNLLMQQV
jgi:hypothetical protein